MKEADAYSRNNWIWAVNLSGFFGWAVVVTPIAYQLCNGTLQNVLEVLIWAAAIGLPIAFGVSWIITAPILKRVMRRRQTWKGAMLWGAAIAAVIYILYFCLYALIFFGGAEQAQYPNLASRLEEADHEISVSYWLSRTTPLVLFTLQGAVIGAVVRWAIGTGSSEG